ncbi:MAG: DUF4157 domain-containing protein [Gammaproteobacteria bacterium]|nr:DUF4157 domain-containing protein [Gammaproteobacteria bacterium]
MKAQARKSDSQISGKGSGQAESATKKRVQTAVANPLWQRMVTATDSTELDDNLVPASFQPASTVGSSDDPLEQEADSVADRVAAGTEPEQPPVTPSEEQIQMKTNGGVSQAPAGLVQAVSTKTGGNEMNPSLRSRIEPVLGADLSRVRVHDDALARDTSSHINARAFTHNNNIFLGPGEHAGDLRLMAHEATHTVQQGASKSLRRWPSVTRTTAETSHSPATIRVLSLSSFVSLTERQLDWATSPALQADAVALGNFRQIQGFGQETGVNRACGGLNMGDIDTKGVPAVFTPLRTYTRGVTSGATAWLRRTTNINDAESWGNDLASLEAVWPQANLSLVMRAPSPRANPSPFEKLVNPAGPELGNFITYLTSCVPVPVLSADNGKEVDSFLALRGEGVMPHNYNATISYVTNYHHFTKITLDGLVSNENFPQWRQRVPLTQRPLTVALYPSVDHNGAFHRNIGMEQLVTNTSVLTIVIEGHAQVLDYQNELAPVAARYGIGGEIQQAMIAGHGSSSTLLLAGTAAGSISGDRLGTAPGTHTTNTTNLMAQLTSLMSSDPARRRILLDACLTDSNQVRSALRATPADAAADVQNAITANPSMRGLVASLAGTGATVLGANASFAPAQTTFIDPVTGELTVQVPGDPDLVASKLQYVEFGTEPAGCMRAVLECWADDQLTGGTDCFDAIQRRITARHSTRVPSAHRNSWREGIIQPIYNLTANSYWGNGETIRQLERLAGTLFHLYWDGNTSASRLHNRLGVLAGTVAHVDQVLQPTSTNARYTSVPRVAAVLEQAWMLYNNTRRSNFMTALARYASCLEASAHVSMGMIMTEVPHLLTLPPASPPPTEELRLALMAAHHQPLPSPAPAILPIHIDFLRQLLAGGSEFPSALGVDAALGGLADEGDILAAIGRPRSGPAVSVGGGPAPAPSANIDPDRDATNLNDFFVTPLSANGVVDTRRSDLMVRSRPTTSSSSNIFARLPKGTAVRIIGEYGNWYAIEQPGRSGFVHQRYIRIIP